MFENVTNKFTKYVCSNEGEKLAALFTDDGVYNDYIYGNFKGRKNIKNMMTNYFHRDAENFWWQMYEHAFKDNIGYAKYRFGFTSKILNYYGRNVVIPGISFFKFKLGSIVAYNESVNGGIAMVQLGVNPQKMEKVFLNWFKRELEDQPSLKNFM